MAVAVDSDITLFCEGALSYELHVHTHTQTQCRCTNPLVNMTVAKESFPILAVKKQGAALHDADL